MGVDPDRGPNRRLEGRQARSDRTHDADAGSAAAVGLSRTAGHFRRSVPASDGKAALRAPGPGPQPPLPLPSLASTCVDLKGLYRAFSENFTIALSCVA